ncbi:hypothetical protein ORI89_08355 [Sphingobacterium sp. UT-1RO-CII-1]|uniref:hypothetical protein n=1 Tax=Sphingobacterium sp. UT-1RO-CII-1 TaxID=2995225 RepID=UPI00227A14CD|nr:hypothetical protein [Sphingobacterium sp. UT-1RO-CII-1]MCY4779661.1 hypothetical protein [Sphingobacterium sp. UT-1RO-CII-1]
MKRIVMLLTLLLFISGCSKEHSATDENETKALIEKVWEYANINPNGFTLNLETMKPIKYGISVAYLETQDSFDKEGLEIVINHAVRNNKIVGGWLNEDNKLYYFDSVKIFKNSDLDEAITFAKQNKQLAIFDLTNLKEIRIEP